jgi:S1-C subfamily serine protease
MNFSMKKYPPIAVFAVVLLALLRPAAAKNEAAKEKLLPVIRVNATTQAYDFFHPWTKRAPVSRRGLGAVLDGGRVLVTAELVANANYVEFEKADGGEKIPATVEAVDYEANLAILKPSDGKFLDGIKPLALTHAGVGDHVAVWQLEPTGELLSTSGLLTTVEVSRYPIDDTALLIYRLTSSLQYRDSSFTVPVAKDGKLIGLLMRYDNRSQNVDVIPAPVIEHFLKAAASKEYRGFPRGGVIYSAMRDPQLRRYAGLKNEETGGVYVTEVIKGGSAEKAGLQTGDVILAIGGNAIDADGNYADPQYGKISLVHLISTKNFDGDAVKFKIFRSGGTLEIPVTLTNRPAEDYVIEPYVIGRAPKYYVLGGLVLQELSRQYLKEWGAEWSKKAPQRFIYMDSYQSELFHDDRKKIVVLTQVLPSPATIGYEDLSSLIVTKINGVELKSLADVETALKNPADGFHKIEFSENPRVIYLDAKQVEDGEPALMQNYGLPAIKRLE